MHLLHLLAKTRRQQLRIRIQNPHLDVISAQHAALDQVSYTPGSTADHVLPCRKQALVVDDWRAPDAGTAAQADGRTEGFEQGADLRCERLGRGDHEHCRRLVW